MRNKGYLLVIGGFIIAILVSQLIGCTGSEHTQLILGIISPDITLCNSDTYNINSSRRLGC